MIKFRKFLDILKAEHLYFKLKKYVTMDVISAKV